MANTRLDKMKKANQVAMAQRKNIQPNDTAVDMFVDALKSESESESSSHVPEPAPEPAINTESTKTPSTTSSTLKQIPVITKKKKPKQTISFRAPDEMYNAISQIAEENNITQSQAVEFLVETALAAFK